jgi:ribonuclease BN (tRNA processing enzyme)
LIVRIQYLPSAIGQTKPSMYLTTYLVNDSFAVDAGVLGYWMSTEDQARVTDVIITHSHLDHVGSLPIFLSNVYDGKRPPVRVYMTEPTFAAVEQHVFDGTTWARLNLLLEANPPLLEIHLIEPFGDRQIGHVKVRTVTVDHPVPTIGVILEDETGSVAISSDTGPTEAFWKACREAKNLKAVFLECSFPNELETQAVSWGHLTPSLLKLELEKLGKPVRTLAVHLKASCEDQVRAELNALKLPHVEVVCPGEVYDFS